MEAIVIPVNCLGVMNLGISGELKNREEPVYLSYKSACKEHRVLLGRPILIIGKKRYIFLPTKMHHKEPSQLKNIKMGIEYIGKNWKRLVITSLAFPPIGHTKEEKKIVKNFLVNMFAEEKIDVELYNFS